MEDKKQFVEELSDVLTAHIEGLDHLTYKSPGTYYAEEVYIYYVDEQYEIINVTYDSPLGILRDICKQGFNY